MCERKQEEIILDLLDEKEKFKDRNERINEERICVKVKF